MRSDPKRWKDLRSELRASGATPVRTTGSHERWRFDDGVSFTVVCNHLSDTVPISILARYRRLRERRGSRAGEEPALLGRAGPRWFRPRRATRMKAGRS